MMMSSDYNMRSQLYTDNVENGTVGGIDLATLKKNLFESGDKTGEANLLEMVKAKRRAEHIDELRKMKIQHQQFRSQKQKEALEIQKAMVELEKKKQTELKLRMEKEKLKQSFEQSDKKDLTKLERSKKEELVRLSRERETLAAQEEALLKEVEALEQEMIRHEENEQKRKNDLENALSKNGASKMEIKRSEMLELAKSHGERLSTLRSEKASLEREKNDLMGALTRMRGGPGRGTDDTDEKDANIVDSIEAMIAQQQVQLNSMKLEYQKDQASMAALRAADDLETKSLRPTTIDKTVPFTMEAETFLSEWLDGDREKKLNADALDEAVKTLDELHPELVPKKEPEPLKEPKTPPLSKANDGNDALRKEIAQLKKQYQQLGSDDPELWAEIQRLESELETSGSSPMVRKVNWAKQTPKPKKDDKSKKKKSSKKSSGKQKKKSKSRRYSSSSNSSSESSGDSSSDSSDSSSDYSKRRRDRSKRRHRNRKGRNGAESEMMRQREFFAQTIDRLGQKMNFLQRTQQMPGPAGQTSGGVARAPALTGTGNEFLDELNTLEMIPRDTELYELKMEQLKQITQMKLEMDSMKQSKALQEMKLEMDQQKRAQRKTNEYEEKLLEQQRLLELAKVKRAIAQEQSSSSWQPTSNKYDPVEGFFIYFDFVTGIPKRFEFVRVVFCLFDNDTAKTAAKALTTCETVAESLTKAQAILADRKRFKNVPGIETLRLVIELQAVVQGENGENDYHSIGWTVLPLFEQVKRGETKLVPGSIKLPLRKPPFRESQIRERFEAPQDASPLFVFVRVVGASDEESASSFVVDPNLTQHLYELPKQMKKSKKSKAATKSEGEDSSEDERNKRKVAPKETLSDSDANSEFSRDAFSGDEDLPPLPSTAKKRRTTVMLDHIDFGDEMRQCKAVEARVYLCADEGSFIKHQQGKKSKKVTVFSAKGDMNDDHDEAKFGMASSDMSFFDTITLSKKSCLLFEMVLQHDAKGSDVDSELSDSEGEMSVKDITTSTMWAKVPVMNDDNLVSTGKMQIKLMSQELSLPLDENEVEDSGAVLFYSIVEHPRSVASVVTTKSRVSAAKTRAKKSVVSAIAEEEDVEIPLVDDEGNEKMWREVALRPPSSKTLYNRSMDGFDIYIDGIRGVPDYATITRVKMRVLDHNYGTVDGFSGMEGHPEPTASAYNPDLSVRAEFHTEASAYPTAMVLVRIDTVHKFSQQTLALGYSLINIFRDASTLEPPQNSTLQEFILNAGGFQLPVYHVNVDKSIPLNMNYFTVAKAPKIPCCTLLMRILPAKKSKDGVTNLSVKDYPESEWKSRGIIVPAPPYNTPNPNLAYVSALSKPSPCEELMYQYFADREQVLVGEVATHAKRVSNPADARVDVMEEEELRTWIRQRFDDAPQFINDTRHYAACSGEHGFRIKILEIVNLKLSKPSAFKVVYSLYPPGLYYQTHRVTENVQFTLYHDWERSISNPAFSDDPRSFRDIAPVPRMSLVVEVHQMDGAGGVFKTQPHSWCILPVFQDGLYCRNGRHQVPLFDGAPNVEMIKSFVNGATSWSSIVGDELLKKKKSIIKYAKGHPSVVISLCDNQVAGIFDADSAPLDTAMVPSALQKKYEVETSLQKKQRLSKMIPKGVPSQTFERNLNLSFQQYSSISHYNL